MPPPTRCNLCDSKVELVNNSEIYRGKEYGDWPYAYLCKACGAYVGLHPNTDLPLGTLADKALREARKAQKASFIRLQHLKGWSRTEAYDWLAKQMKIPKDHCHWGWFDLKQCATAGALCKKEFENV